LFTLTIDPKIIST